MSLCLIIPSELNKKSFIMVNSILFADVCSGWIKLLCEQHYCEVFQIITSILQAKINYLQRGKMQLDYRQIANIFLKIN